MEHLQLDGKVFPGCAMVVIDGSQVYSKADSNWSPSILTFNTSTIPNTKGRVLMSWRDPNKIAWPVLQII